MKSFYQFLENKDYPSKEEKEYWDKEEKERKKIYDKIMDIAQSNFDDALNQYHNYESFDDAILSYAQNAEDTAREEGLKWDDQIAAFSLVHKLYDDYKAKLKS